MSDVQYEYKTIRVQPVGVAKRHDRKRERILNEYGADGWEIIDVKLSGFMNPKDTVTLRKVKS